MSLTAVFLWHESDREQVHSTYYDTCIERGFKADTYAHTDCIVDLYRVEHEREVAGRQPIASAGFEPVASTDRRDTTGAVTLSRGR